MVVNYIVISKGNSGDPNVPKQKRSSTPSLIKRSKITFRSGVDLKEMLARFKYENVK
jgi:hypothetical protein